MQTDIEDFLPRRRAVLRERMDGIRTAVHAVRDAYLDGITNRPEPTTTPPPVGGGRTRRLLLDRDAFLHQAPGTSAEALRQVGLAARREQLKTVTAWDTQRPPPCTGYWDTSFPGNPRRWYDFTRKIWRMGPDGPITDTPLSWSGLREPWPEGYPYPVPAPGRSIGEVHDASLTIPG